MSFLLWKSEPAELPKGEEECAQTSLEALRGGGGGSNPFGWGEEQKSELETRKSGHKSYVSPQNVKNNIVRISDTE